MLFELIITRHAGLVDFLKNEGVVDDGVTVVSHATADDVRGKKVIGVLPIALVFECKVFAEIPLNLPAEMRGKELTSDDVKKYAGEITAYFFGKQSENYNVKIAKGIDAIKKEAKAL